MQFLFVNTFGIVYRYKRVDFVKYLTKPLCPIGSVLELKKVSFSSKLFLFRK